MDSIRKAVAVGYYQPGESLTERQLCDLTGVSRTLVREALRQLESEGLVEVVAHRGPKVAQLTRTQAEGVYQVRASLEGLAAQLFAEKATPQRRQAIRDAFDHLREAFQHDDAVTRLEAKNRFYEELIAGSGNEALGDTLHIINSRVTILRATSLQAPGRAQESLAELEELVAALVAGEPERARRAAERHVNNAAAVAISRLEDPDDAAG